MMGITGKSKDEGRHASKAEQAVESATTGEEQFQPDEINTDNPED